MIRHEDAPALQSLFTSVNKDKPDVGCTVRVVRGRKHFGKIGTVRRHVRSAYGNPYRYGNAMQHHMTDARGRDGFRIMIETESETFWTEADYVMVCCTK